MRNLTDKVAIITGASRGIGTEIAAALAKEGARVILVARSEPLLHRVAERISAAGGCAQVLCADLSKRGTPVDLVRHALALTGRIDILVNNAAAAECLPYHRYTPEELEREMFTNFMAPLLLSRHVLPLMLAQGEGHIVHISSLAGEIPVAYLAAYSGAKAGLTGFVRSLRQELSGTGVSASAVLPGVVRDRGMIRDYELRSGTPTTGIFATTRNPTGCTSEQVALGVVRAVKRDLPCVIINRHAVRPLLALLALAPKPMERVMRLFGLHHPTTEAASTNLQSLGALTGITIAPDATVQAMEWYDGIVEPSSRTIDRSKSTQPRE